jgi:hypothetical protein
MWFETAAAMAPWSAGYIRLAFDRFSGLDDMFAVLDLSSVGSRKAYGFETVVIDERNDPVMARNTLEYMSMGNCSSVSVLYHHFSILSC